MKKIIITIDDVGLNKDVNDAFLELQHKTFLNFCTTTNTKEFKAIKTVLKQNNNTGIHLNICEKKPILEQKNNLLISKNGDFNNSFIKILINSYNKKYLNQVEKEFRAQIEKSIKNEIKPSFINSHIHIHSIPRIFNLTCKLAKEYKIPNVRTQNELFYFCHPTKDYPLNIVKNIILKIFTKINKKTLRKYNLKTNDYMIGILYTGKMNKETIFEGIKKIIKENTVTEIILHPTTNKIKKTNYIELLTLLNEDFEKELRELNVNIINWKENI